MLVSVAVEAGGDEPLPYMYMLVSVAVEAGGDEPLPYMLVSVGAVLVAARRYMAAFSSTKKK